jgi:hypothetical protein
MIGFDFGGAGKGDVAASRPFQRNTAPYNCEGTERILARHFN